MTIGSNVRTCGKCSLCCKLLGVYTIPGEEPKIDKPRNEWCTYCDKSNGCRIYETRPQPCRDFMCLWLVHPEMAEELRPDRSHIVMYSLTDQERQEYRCDVVIMEDPSYFKLRESLKRPLIHKAVETMTENGLRVTIGNKDIGYAIGRH